MVMCMYDVYYY